MMLSEAQRSVIERVLNTVETGRPEGRYDAISIYADGPHGMRQITYGRSQTTEYGNLRMLVHMYAEAGGMFSPELAQYADRVGSEALTTDRRFKELLRKAGRQDPAMHSVQDRFFDQRYFQPAMDWADAHGFSKALSALVIYDSFIHSGGILWFLRQRFAESPPAGGGREEVWISQYVQARHAWLATHSKSILRKTVYRTQAYLDQIAAGNWDLSMLPVRMNGVDVFAA